jgi:Fe-S cluster assembly protein SufD
MTDLSAASQSYADRFGAVAGTLPGAGLAWLDTLRRAGLDRFVRTGLPTPRVEDWKYTNLGGLEKLELVPATGGGIAPELPPTITPDSQACHRLVIVNGLYRADLSHIGDLPPGASLGGLAPMLDHDADWLETHMGRIGGDEDAPLLALNTAFAGDGPVLRLDPGTVLEAPIEVTFLSVAEEGPAVHHPRALIVLGAGASATCVEHHLAAGGESYFANCATEIVMAEGAALRHYKLQDEAYQAHHIAVTVVRLAADASYDNFSLSLGGRLARNEIRVRLDGPGARCGLMGAYLAGGRQHTDSTTIIEHASPDTASREIYKGVLDGKARAVFQGRITVQEDAQRIEGHQLNRTLLLSDGAEIDCKPELEIFADDVKCSHGATAGELDDDALFYLRSRGIPEDQARGILVAAFLDEIMDEIADDGVREAFRQRVVARLEQSLKNVEAS